MSASAEPSAPARQAPRPGPAETATASVAVGTGAAAAVNAAAATLLKLEGDVRQLRTQGEIAHFMANETRIATRAQQIAVLARVRGGKLVVRAVSAIAHVDRSAPLVALFEGVVAGLERKHGLEEARELEATAFVEPGEQTAGGYPLRSLLWVPFLDPDGVVIGGLLQARAAPWAEHEIQISRHLAGAAAHAWWALDGRRSSSWLPFRLSRRMAAVTALALGALALVPVSMSALAPVEVAPREPLVVTAGVDGVIEAVLVKPNDTVHKGQSVVRMADTVLRNRLEIAEREVAVADARLKKATQLAFVDMRGRHELGLARAELELRLAERDYARELLERSEIRAERDGVALFGDIRDLVGRSVATGEKLMEIADPKAMELRIDLPVSEAIVLTPGARIRVFLDSDPLSPLDARLVRADYRARPRDNQLLAFRLVAHSEQPEARGMRLGVRGTARVMSETVPLGFYLFRRPIAVARQWMGL